MSAENVSQIFEQKDDFDMENSTLEFDIYHFKVMELTTLEDTGRLNECKIRFHFYHRLIKKKNEFPLLRKRKSLISTDDVDSEWDLSVNSAQRIFLSRDTKLLMDVVNNRFALVYKR